MIPALLYLLATLDAAFCGYRDAAGRNALIFKRAYYRRAMLRGAIYGQLAIAIIGVVSAIFILSAAEPLAKMNDLLYVGERMLHIYLPYAVVIFIGFALRMIPSVDIRSLTSALIFGPLLLIRPLTAVVGVGWGVLAAPQWDVIALGLLVFSLMLSLEWFIGWAK